MVLRVGRAGKDTLENKKRMNYYHKTHCLLYSGEVYLQLLAFVHRQDVVEVKHGLLPVRVVLLRG